RVCAKVLAQTQKVRTTLWMQELPCVFKAAGGDCAGGARHEGASSRSGRDSRGQDQRNSGPNAGSGLHRKASQDLHGVHREANRVVHPRGVPSRRFVRVRARLEKNGGLFSDMVSACTFAIYTAKGAQDRVDF